MAGNSEVSQDGGWCRSTADDASGSIEPGSSPTTSTDATGPSAAGEIQPLIDARSRWLTVPNLLTFYRLLAAPAIAGLALYDQRRLFVIFLCLSLISDVLDGLIARAFRLVTKIGARLDSIADDMTYVAAIVGIFRFEYDSIRPHVEAFYVFLLLLILTTAIPLVKFRRTPAFHLYSFRINGYVQTGFMLYLFLVEFNVYFYYAAVIYGIVACLEVILVTLVVDEPITDAQGLYWVLRRRRGTGHR